MGFSCLISELARRLLEATADLEDEEGLSQAEILELKLDDK